MGKVSPLKAALPVPPFGMISFHDLHSSAGSYLPNEKISCANADVYGCDCEVVSDYFKHPSSYCTWCISLSIDGYDDANGDSEAEVPRIERFSIAASSTLSRGTQPASSKSSGGCLPCHSRTSTDANKDHPRHLQEECTPLPRADSAGVAAGGRPPRTSLLPGRTSSHIHSQEMRQPGSLDYSHPDIRPGWLECAAFPHSEPAAATVEAGGGSVEFAEPAAAGLEPIPTGHSLL